MLFNATITKLQNTCQNIEGQIEDLQRQIEILREQKLALESHLQQLGSAEAAAESAIEQTRTAINIISAVSEAELITFKEAIDSLFNSTPPLLTQAPEEAEEEITVEPNPETPDGDTLPDEPEAPVDSSLAGKSYKDLQEIARQHGINPRQSKRILAGLIRDLLTA
jgi:leucyl aminopeptidase (aminopeptidase T)